MTWTDLIHLSLCIYNNFIDTFLQYYILHFNCKGILKHLMTSQIPRLIINTVYQLVSDF